METIEGTKLTTETLGRVSLSSQPTDDSHKILKPSSEERAGNDLGLESEALYDKMECVGGVAAVVVTKTVVEESEVSVVKMIQEDKEEIEGALVKNRGNEKMEVETGEGFEHSVVEEKEGNEIKENEKRRVFGNLVGDDDEEDMKVKCSGNGISLVVDIKGSLAGENGSEVKPVFEGDTGSLAHQHEENAGEEPMDVCLSGQKEKHENGAEIFESEEDMSKNDEGNVGEESTKVGESDSKSGMHEEEDTGGKLVENEAEYDREEDESQEDHDFVVGDFVWGKIKSHPWWPGQIYDPVDASDYAAKVKRKGRLLVAYFGDGSFSWCLPSQLKPFVEYFEEMSNQSDSKKFVNAVQDALEEVSRLVKAELMCKCQTVDRIENPRAANSGIKAGVPVPKGNTIKVLIDRMEPVELLSTLKAAATMGSSTRMLELELTVLRSCLSAFYRRKGGYLLPVYQEPKCIVGLEDKMRSGIVGNSDVNGPSECADNGDDKLYRERKQKSVAELLGEGMSVEDEPKIKKAKTSKDGASGTKSSSGMKRERKRKVVVVSESPESDHESGGVEEETLSSPRQRKKSKYLSPPYTSPIWSGKVSGSGSGLGSGSIKEPKTDPEKVPEMADKQLEDPFKRSSGKKSHQRGRSSEGSDSQDSREHKKGIDATVNVSKVLHGLLRAALDPSCLMEKKNLPTITDFISSFRSSIFEEGPNYQIYQPDRKKESPMTLLIEFPSAVSLPTKADLLKTYRKFGGLMKKETHIMQDSSCAFVGFANSSDAEAALTMSQEKKLFGGVKYHLCDVAAAASHDATSSVKRGSRKAVAEDMSDLGFIKQKLEQMSEVVKKCGAGEMSGRVKASLEGGMKELLEKVSKMG